MKILCLMGLFPKEYESTILKYSISGVQNAANKFQWGIVNGLEEVTNGDIQILNSLYIGSYPKRYRKLIIPTFKFSHTNGASDLNVGFVNLFGYKMISRFFSLKKEIDIWIKKTYDDEQVVLAYAMTSPMVELLYYIKKKYKKVVCCLVVPDLPEYMAVSAKKASFYKVAKTIQIRMFKHLLKEVDCYVLLTKNMTEWFDWDIKYTIVEGICSEKASNYPMEINENKKKSLLYAGMLEKKYGVINLVKSFSQINAPDWSLELYGSGSALKQINEFAQKDKRIHVHGTVSNKIVVAEQKKVELLINPRDGSNEFTRYSFPSKIIEYLSSGTPMLGYKLPGMPDDYIGYFYEITSEKNGMRDCIIKAMNLTKKEREDMGHKALEFILNEKNAKKQCEKIFNMLNSFFK